MGKDPRTAQPDEFPLNTLKERMRLHHERDVVVEPIILEDVVTAVLDTMDGRLSPTEARLLGEIAGLGRIIEQAKADIAGVSADAITASHIPSATIELDAIVEHTATATNSILESCELLDNLANTLDSAQASVVQNAVTQIYEACSFQDITGQRITKVVKALKAIEKRVLQLSGSLAAHGGQVADFAEPEDPNDPEKSLLNGPMLPREAMGQNDIDKLLADFD